MSSYLPPRKNLESFNSVEFQSSLTSEEIESKVKNLETKNVIAKGLNDDAASSGTQSFGITYTSTPVITCQVILQTFGGYVSVNIHSVTTTGFSYRKYRTGTGGQTSVSSDGQFYWTAIGDV